MTHLPGRVVLFDCDGVLVDSDASVNAAWSRWASEHNLAPEDVMAVVHGRRSADTVASFVASPQREQALARIDRYELAAAAQVGAVHGAARLLASLPSDAWAVVTSGRRELALARLAAAGLPIPRVVVTADDVRRGKPDPEGYLLAAAELGVPAAEAIVVEDSPEGIEAARSAEVGAVLGVGDRALRSAPDVAVPHLEAVRWDGSGLVIEA